MANKSVRNLNHSILFLLVIVFVSGSTSYLNNSNFAQTTSLSDITSWYILNNNQPNIDLVSTANDWDLVNGTTINQRASSNYLTLNGHQCAIQKIAFLPEGNYEAIIQVYTPGNTNLNSIDSVYVWVVDLYSQAPHSYQAFTPTVAGQASVISNKFSLETSYQDIYFAVCTFENVNTYYFSNSYLIGNPFPSSIANCRSQQTIGLKKICTACQLGYVLDKSSSSCVPAVTYCSVYKNEKCTLCIEGYFLNNNQCFRLSSECTKTDSNGLCAQCQKGFSVVNGLCLKDVPIPTCTATQFLTADNQCAEGNVPNCNKYLSRSGQCSSCEANYKLNQFKFCVFTCPPDTATQKYVQRKRECILTDINCLLVNDDGTCAACNEGFYAIKDLCYRINTNSQLTVESNTDDAQKVNIQKVTEQIKTDESNNSYLARVDGSRIYLTGPWKNLQVWSDQKGDLFVKVANEGRKYLTGSNQGLIAFQDANRNWFAINGEGKKFFL